MRTRNSQPKGTDLEEETKSEKKTKKKNVKIEKSEEQSISQALTLSRRSRRVNKENSSLANLEEEIAKDKPGPSGIQKQKQTKSKNTQKASQKVQRQPISKSLSETSTIPRKIHPSLQRNKISRSATPAKRLVKPELEDTQLPPESDLTPEEMPELIPELIPKARLESTHEQKPSNSLENTNDSSIPKQETKEKKVKNEKKHAMNSTDNGTAGKPANEDDQNASIIDLDEVMKNATECIVLSDTESVLSINDDSDDGIQVIGEVRKAAETSLVDLTNDPIIDQMPGPSGLQARNRKRKSDQIDRSDDKAQPVKSRQPSNSSNQNGIFGDISQQQILDDIMMIAQRHADEEKRREVEQQACQKRLAERRAARERFLAEQFKRNLGQKNPERQRAPYNFSGGLFAGQTIRPDPLISVPSSNVNEAPTLIFSSMPTLAPVRAPPQKVKANEPSSNSTQDSKEDSQWTCPICMDTLSELKAAKKLIWSTPCGHLFCKICLQTSLKSANKNVCPTCRKKTTWAKTHQVFM